MMGGDTYAPSLEAMAESEPDARARTAAAQPADAPEFLREPPGDGQEYDCQCARCGSSATFELCEYCGGKGTDGHDCGEDCCCCAAPEDNVPCEICDGRGRFSVCISSASWCHAHPLPGRESITPGTLEWFKVQR